MKTPTEGTRARPAPPTAPGPPQPAGAPDTPAAHTSQALPTPRRIAFVVTRGDTPGGAQTHVRDLAARLQADGVEVRVFTGATGIFTDELAERGVPFTLIPNLRREISPAADLRAVAALASRLRRFAPDLVSTHTAKAGMVGRVAARLIGAPVVFTAHGWQFAPGIPPLQRAVVYATELVLSRLSAAVITVSRFDLRLARRSAAAPPRRLHLVRNGLPDAAPAPPPAAARPPAAAERPLRLVMVARFQEQKDHTTLIHAVHALRTLYPTPPRPLPNLQLQLVGDGPLLQACRSLAEELNVGDQIAFLGERGDVAELLAVGDIYVLTSHWEGLPRSIIEAMRAALPVVATNVGGVNELVEHGQTGYLVTPRDPHRLAARLSELLADDELRARLGAAGRRRYERELTFDAMYHNTRRVYAHVLAPAHARDRAPAWP